MKKFTGNLFVLALVLGMILMPALGLPASNNVYETHNLVSDGSIPADHTDVNLVNPWGIAFNPNGFVWIADNGTGVSTFYDSSGVPQSLVVTLPASSAGPASPTGIVHNGSSGFVVQKGRLSAPSIFIFASENGTIAGWSPTVDPANAILAVDNSPSGAIYKGLTIATNDTGDFLFAADFHNAKIDVFDSNFQPAVLAGSFSDPYIPAGFAPFNIQNLEGELYVTYAKQDAAKEDDVPGLGRGFVNVFDANGNLIKRVASRGFLNAPWGLAIAPADFGYFSNHLLVGNFGNGTINAYALGGTDLFVGRLRGSDGRLLKIDGLWGLSFANGAMNQPANALFFTAGPNAEANGLYGTIEPVSTP
jgi:uncharacterized protein (TIGR03118 family)